LNLTLAKQTGSTTDGSSFATTAFTPTAGDLLVVIVASSGTTDPSSVSDTGQGFTWTKVTSCVKNTSADTMYMFVPSGLAAAVSTTITWSCGATTATGAFITVIAITGMAATGLSAVRQSAVQNNATAASTPTVTLGQSINSANPLIGAVFNASSPATMTPPTGWTEFNDAGYTTPTTGMETVGLVSGGSGTTVTWGNTSTASGAIVAEFAAPVVATSTSSPGGLALVQRPLNHLIQL